MLQAGTYFARLKEAITTQTKSGSLQVVMTFNVTHYWNGSQWQPITPQERKLYLSLHDNAWQYTEAKLKHMGFNGDFAAPQFSAAVRDKGIELICQHETHNGKTREKWELAQWGGGAEAEKAPADVLSRLSARWKTQNGGSVPRPASPAPAINPTDDLPI